MGTLTKVRGGALLCALWMCGLGCSGSSDSGNKTKSSVSQPGTTANGMQGTGGSTGTGGSSAASNNGNGSGAGGAAHVTGSGGTSGTTTGAAGMGMTTMTGSGGASAMTGSGGATSTTPPTPHGDKTCLMPGDGSYGETGPYQVGMMDVDLGMQGTMNGMICPNQTTSKYTIFYPMPLEADCPHPIVAWGNGTGVNSDMFDAYSFFSANAAAWGVVVIAAHDPNSGCGEYHKVGIDYLLAQNNDPKSMFYQKLSTRAGVAGHSQGGIGATAGSQHPNVEAEVSVAGGGVPKDKIAFICLTGTMDMVEGPCTQSYMSATGPSFLADWMNGDHTTTETASGYFMRDPGTLQMQRLYAAWFRCWLADDKTACALFDGAPSSCGICMDTGWAKHESRNF